MQNRKDWLGIFAIVLVFGMMAGGCSNGTTTTHNNDAGPLEGTWTGQVLVLGMMRDATVVVTYSGWTLNVPAISYTDTGSFHRNGNSAVLYSNTDRSNVGTAVMTDEDTISLVLNSNSDAPGTYILTRSL